MSEVRPAISLDEGVVSLRDVEFRRLMMVLGERFDLIGIDYSIHKKASKPLHPEFISPRPPEVRI